MNVEKWELGSDILCSLNTIIIINLSSNQLHNINIYISKKIFIFYILYSSDGKIAGDFQNVLPWQTQWTETTVAVDVRTLCFKGRIQRGNTFLFRK